MTTTGHRPILPPGTVEVARRMGFNAAGLAVMGGAVGVFAALLSYTPGDPSFNNATNIAAANYLGAPGAHVADLLLQVTGIAGGLLVPALVAWGWQLMHRQRVSLFGVRVILMLAAMALLATVAATLPVPKSWPLASGLGGAAGTLLLERLSALAALAVGPTAKVVVTGIAGLLGLAAFLTGLGLTRADWAGLGRGLLGTIGLARRAGELSAALGERLAELRIALPRIPFLDTADEEESEPHLIEDAPKPKRKAAKKRVAKKAPRPRAGRKAQAERQQSLDFGLDEGYLLPPLDLLEAPDGKGRETINQSALEQNARLLESVLADFGVKGEIIKVRPGPVVTLYELAPAPGTKTSRVIGLADDIARSMSAVSVRVAVVPGQNVIGIELPNSKREMVALRELLASEDLERSGGKLVLALGKDIGGAPILVDLARMPHLLIAGTTGSGKSVAINTMILSLLYQLPPETCKFIMIDPKMLELSVYDGIPHLLSPVVTDPGKAVVALKWTVREMEDRYRLMSQLGVRNVAGYNARLAEALKKGEELTRRVQTGFDDTGAPVFEDQPLSMDPLPFIVVVVDEMADLMLVAGKDIEAAVQRLAQMARAAGIHLIMATQRPSVDVITGTIKANFPTRVSFQVTSKIDSRTILGEQGAEQLLGQGDMLYMAGGGRISRVHGPFVSDEEVEMVVSHLKDQAEPAYVEAVTEESEDGAPMFLGDPAGGANGAYGAVGGNTSESDALYDQAVAVVAREGKASTSFIQRHLQIGYNRAARIIERMEAEGVVSKANRVGRREVLVGNAAAE